MCRCTYHLYLQKDAGVQNPQGNLGCEMQDPTRAQFQVLNAQVFNSLTLGGQRVAAIVNGTNSTLSSIDQVWFYDKLFGLHYQQVPCRDRLSLVVHFAERCHCSVEFALA